MSMKYKIISIVPAVCLLFLFSLVQPAYCDAPVFVCISIASEELAGSEAEAAARQGLVKAFIAGRNFDVLSPDVLQSTVNKFKSDQSKGLTQGALRKIAGARDIDLLLVYDPALKIKKTEGRENIATISLTAQVVNGQSGAMIQEKNAQWTFTIAKDNTDPANSPVVEKAIRVSGKALGEAIVQTEEVLNLFLTLGS